MRLLEQVAHAGGAHQAVAAHRDPGAIADRLVETHDEIVGVVVGKLDGVDLDAAPGEGDDRSRRRCGVAVGDAQRHREALRLVDHVAQPGAMREQRQVHGVRSAVGGRVGVARGPCQTDPHPPAEQPVAVAAVVEHGHAEVGLADVDVTVGADLELGGVPRGGRMRRAPDVPELDVAGGGVGADVERERHRQQVLVVLPVELDADVEPR